MFDAIDAAVRQVLSARGPMTEDDLHDALVADGVDLGRDAEATLAEALDGNADLVMPLADGRWALIPAVLDGRVFTHRLGEAEVAHDLLEWGPDLAPVSMLTELDAYRRLADGAPVGDAFALLDEDADAFAARGVPAAAIGGEGALLLPPGCLAGLGVRAGDLVGLRVTADGFDLTVVVGPAPSAGGAALAALLEEHPDRPEMLDNAVWTVCADDEGLFREPTTPLSELLATSGLACEGDWIARAGFDFAEWRLNARIEAMKERYELDDDEALAVLAVVGIYEQVLDAVEGMRSAETAPPADDEVALDLDREIAAAALESLAEPAVAAAALDEMDVHDDQSAAALGVFAETAEPLAPRAARPALRWMRAKALEALGGCEEAEATLHAAESLDPSWPLTLLSLARYAGDRGDAERGLALLRRAGAPDDDELVQLFARFRPAPRAGLGRNERCWCGSGRKYKACHLNREQLPLEQRAAWLYQKATTDLLDGAFGSLFVDAAEARAQYGDDPEALVAAFGDPLVCDAVLFEGGAFAEFLDTRGFLLPDDERALAEQWLLVRRSVHEVLDVSPGQGFTLRDVRTGEVCEVRERTASGRVKAGEYYCARVVPAGETMQIFGGMEPVSPGERDGLIALLDGEPDPVDLVVALSRRFAASVR
ncbi:SEC-C metal-binding domain-containing protein [Mycobacterium servetii]|uniref:SEC-C metal-binding domain-containing protein n=1 Tax=Mycobacterium servetii TaxID=3237418 RepID=A0ABV4C7D4_9MYCO